MSKYKHGSLACNGNGQKALVLVNSGEWTWMVWCLAIWSEKMIICANVNNEGGHFLVVGPKAIWLIYFKEI